MLTKLLSFNRFVAIFVQKLWEGKSCQNLFSAILRLNFFFIKFRWPISPGGGLGLNGPAIKIFFCSFPHLE